MNMLVASFWEGLIHATGFAFAGNRGLPGIAAMEPGGRCAGGGLEPGLMAMVSRARVLSLAPVGARWLARDAPSWRCMQPAITTRSKCRPTRPDGQAASSRPRWPKHCVAASLAEEDRRLSFALLQTLWRGSWGNLPPRARHLGGAGGTGWPGVMLGSMVLGMVRLASGLWAIRRLRSRSDAARRSCLDRHLSAVLRAEMSCSHPVEVREFDRAGDARHDRLESNAHSASPGLANLERRRAAGRARSRAGPRLPGRLRHRPACPAQRRLAVLSSPGATGCRPGCGSSRSWPPMPGRPGLPAARFLTSPRSPRWPSAATTGCSPGRRVRFFRPVALLSGESRCFATPSVSVMSGFRPESRFLTVGVLAALGVLIAGLRGPMISSPALAQDNASKPKLPAAASRKPANQAFDLSLPAGRNADVRCLPAGRIAGTARMQPSETAPGNEHACRDIPLAASTRSTSF